MLDWPQASMSTARKSPSRINRQLIACPCRLFRITPCRLWRQTAPAVSKQIPGSGSLLWQNVEIKALFEQSELLCKMFVLTIATMRLYD